MTISENKIYPRTGDTHTVYLKNVITNDSIKVGDYTMYNDFVHDPREFQKNNVLYHYPVSGSTYPFPIFLRNGDWTENRIQKNIAAIQAGRIEDLE